MKVALVYDRVNKVGGAEKVLLVLHEIWPKAPLFTAVFDSQGAFWAKGFKVIPSFLQKIPFFRKRHEFIPWLTPFAFESFNFSSFDVVISVTSAEAKFVITKPETLHICYCLTPTRYLWSGFGQYSKNPGFGVVNKIAGLFFNFVAPKMRMIDQIASERPDYYVAISKEVQSRIKKYYRRNSEVIYPPVEVDKLATGNWQLETAKKDEGYFLVVSRLVPYKKIDLIIKAFNKLGWNLKIVGTGNQENHLKKIARVNIEFLGHLTEEELIYYYQKCQALVIACEEDFGLAPLEVQACGKPVIAFDKGGVGETVVGGKTGLFFQEQTVKSLHLALNRFIKLKFNSLDCRKNAKKFSKKIFVKKFKNFVERRWEDYQK